MKPSNNLRKKSPADDSRAHFGGANIFKSLGRPNADEAFVKVEMAYKIHTLIRDLGLNQTQAAKLLGTDRARISNLTRGRLTEFSLESLLHFLQKLDQDITITIRPKRHAEPELHVLAKAG